MILEHLITGPLDVNTYLIAGEGETECAVIDPADSASVLKRMEQLGFQCTHILLTHGHFDHTGGVAALKEATGAKVCIHALDANMLFDPVASMAATMGIPADPCCADMLLGDGDTIRIASLSLEVIHTPGHTPGGVSYLVKDILFTGDTLFRLSVGRADFPGSDTHALYNSVAVKLFGLPGADYAVYPGHMRRTTLAFERTHNPFVRHYKGPTW